MIDQSLTILVVPFLGADEVAQLSVRANAETIQDLKTAMQFGAKELALLIEHMFFGENEF